MRRLLLFLVLLAVIVLQAVLPARAQDAVAATDGALALTLPEAIELALARHYAVRGAELDAATARAQVREAWGSLLPTVDGSASYTRNVVTANPFAGSDAGSLFSGLGAINWLAFNEQARTDDDPATNPIPLDEFFRRQEAGYVAAGVEVGGNDNPFGVPNQFQTGLTVTQTLFSGVAFAAIKGARAYEQVQAEALSRQQQLAVHEVRQAYYGALLAQEQAEVLRASVARAAETVSETARRVSVGTLPKFERLSAEVQLANLETQRIQAVNQAASARDQLLYAIGLPVGTPVRLRGELDVPDDVLATPVSVSDAVRTALERRPDLERARLGVRLARVNRDLTRAEYLPSAEAFATLGYSGNVPGNRQIVRSNVNPDDPFEVDVEDRGFFSDAYWQPAVAVGVRLQWSLFSGLQTSARVQQQTIAVRQAELQLAQAVQAVTLEVEVALRDLDAARQRIAAQRTNVTTAELAYTFADERLGAGVATPLDVRTVSTQLDQARLGYDQAVYDYLLALSALERAIGVMDVAPHPGVQLTQAQP